MKDSLVYIFLITCIIIIFISYKVSNCIINYDSSPWFISFFMAGLIVIPLFVFFYVKDQKNKEIETILIGFIFSLIISFCVSSTFSLVKNLLNIYVSKDADIEKFTCVLTKSNRKSSFLAVGYEFKDQENIYYYSGKDYLYNDISNNLDNFKIKIRVQKGRGKTYILKSIDLFKITK